MGLLLQVSGCLRYLTPRRAGEGRIASRSGARQIIHAGLLTRGPILRPLPHFHPERTEASCLHLWSNREYSETPPARFV